MSVTRTFMMMAALSVVVGNTANAQPGPANHPMSEIELDRKLVEQGSLPPSVLTIDAELAKLPRTDPRTLQLMKQRLAAIQQHSDGLREQQETMLREQQNRLHVIQTLTNLADRPPPQQQPQEQQPEQRMCAVNNGQVGYLRPC